MNKIALIGPGLLPIPTNGWGAVETIVYNSKEQLSKRGFDVYIINNPSPRVILDELKLIRPDIVHIHYDPYIYLSSQILLPSFRIAFTCHYGYLSSYSSNLKAWLLLSKLRVLALLLKPLFKVIGNHKYKSMLAYCSILNDMRNLRCNFFGIADAHKQVSGSSNFFLMPNSVDVRSFRYSSVPDHCELAIYLGKIEPRKMQYYYQSIESIRFVGSVKDPRFDTCSSSYLGEWTQVDVKSNLTNFASLVLLSSGEAHPLVCIEALSAGLSLVVSEGSAANLDISLPFVNVIPNHMLSSVSYVEDVIRLSNQNSAKHRQHARSYALSTFDHEAVFSQYVDHWNKIINSSTR